MRVAVISDTHLPGRGRVLPAACVARLRDADLIVHAGDWSDAAALAAVRAIGPLVAVHGNVEEPAVRAALPATAEVEVGGLRLGVVHDAGPEAGRLRAAAAPLSRGRRGVVFGHSHIPLHEVAADGFFILNPGSPTDRRRAPRHSMAEIVIADGRATRRRASWAVDDPAGPLAAELVRGAAARATRLGPMDLFVTLIGTAASVPTSARGTAATLVARGGERWLIDCGEGTQRQLLRSGLGLIDLDLILITHMHGDHYLGLPGLFKTYGLRGRERPLALVGPRGLIRLMETLRPIIGRLPFAVETWRSSTSPAPRSRCGARASASMAFPTRHSVASVGYALRGGRGPGAFDARRRARARA